MYVQVCVKHIYMYKTYICKICVYVKTKKEAMNLRESREERRAGRKEGEVMSLYYHFKN